MQDIWTSLLRRERRSFLLVFFALAPALFALPSRAQAVTPAPDGGYPNQNTAEGDGALNSLTTGYGNTATGFQALYSLTTSSANTATGWWARATANANRSFDCDCPKSVRPSRPQPTCTAVGRQPLKAAGLA
jgi:hypothetical protein